MPRRQKGMFIMEMNADVVIAGTGVGGLFSALNLPADRKIIMIMPAPNPVMPCTIPPANAGRHTVAMICAIWPMWPPFSPGGALRAS